MLAILTPTAHAGVSATFADACDKLDAGEYAEARDALAGMVEAGHMAPAVFFQLGNANYRLEDPGQAALAYRRASFLDPDHRESAQNLEFLRRTVGFVDTFEPSGWEFVQRIPSTWLSRGLTAGIWLAGLAAGAWIVIRRRPHWVGVSLLLCVVLGVGTAAAAGVFAAQKRAALPPGSSVVVVASDVVARSAPAETAAEVYSLPPGSALIPVAERGPWTYVDLPGELRGWVRASATEPLWPYDPVSAP